MGNPCSNVATTAYFEPQNENEPISFHVVIYNKSTWAASCVVECGGQKQTVKVEAGGRTVVWFDKLTFYDGHKVYCEVL